MVTFYLEIGERFSFSSPCISGQAEGHSHLQGTGPSVFIEHFAVLHDLAIKECLWERKNLFHNSVPSFVFSHQGDSPLVPASGYATGKVGKLDHENSTGW